MSTLSSDLLRLLGSQAVPGVAPGSSAASPANSGGIDFATLLHQAQAGKLASGREVTIGRSAGVKLSDDQIKRISAAADLAESQGATRALVMIDGMAIKLDVSMREVTGMVDLKKTGVLTGIDAVVEVPSSEGASAASTSSAEAAGSSLLKALASRVSARSGKA